MIDKVKFTGCMAGLQAYFGKILTDEVLEMYWDSIKNLDEIDFVRAVANLKNNFITTSACPFPLIAHFLESCGRAPDQQAQNVITKLRNAIREHGKYNTINFGNGALHTVIVRYGGWPAICTWSDKDWQLNERNFIAAYKAAMAYGDTSGPVIGITEAENKLTGYDKYTPPPVQIIEEKTKPKITQNSTATEYSRC